MRENRTYSYLGTVQGMCRGCRAIIPCRILEQGGAVYQERLCPTCGLARARIADDVRWYMQRVGTAVHCRASPVPGAEVVRGCPHDCGPCAFHANACHLPVFSITNACQLTCPICFTYNRPDRSYFMGREELRRLLDNVIKRSGPLDLINITGGEPTLHPGLVELLEECRRPEIGRVTLNCNGLRLAEDQALCEHLARLRVYVILSFDTFDPERSRRIHGRDVVAAKLRAMENLQRLGIGTTLMNVMIRGVNEDEIGRIIDLARTHSVVRSITVQTMTFTGQGGKDFPEGEHMPLDGAADAIQRATSGEMRQEHFVAHPGAHPLCYSVAYYFRGRRCRSFTDLLTTDELRQMLAGGYLLHPTEQSAEQFKMALDRLWARGDDPELLRQIRSLIQRLYPAGRSLGRFEQQRIAEDQILTVYIHSHMDEDRLDLGRLMACPDQVPDAEGRMIPACSYNLFYRMKDQRFYAP
jgi:hypothetical protein